MTDSTPIPVEAEVLGVDVVQVHYVDRVYVMPASLDDADGGVLEAIEDEKLSYAIRHLLGPEQWKSFKATKPKIRDYVALFDTYAKLIGLRKAGE